MSFNIRELHGTANTVPRTESVKYIVVHYVGAGNSSAGSAAANCRYFSSDYRGASAHYFIDDSEVCEYADPAERVTWHCGDGRGRYGITNSNSAGIEVCNNGGPFTEAEIERLAWLVQMLMGRFGIDSDRVVRHYDASRKLCPAFYAENQAEWDNLKARITNGAYTPSQPLIKPSSGIVVDGWWGSVTTMGLQEYFGTPRDGVVSGQWAIRRQPAFTSGWEWNDGNGSQLIIAMQMAMNITVDGIVGPQFIDALELRYGFNADERLDGPSNTVKAMQQALNSGAF